jgi:hypothetical protein
MKVQQAKQSAPGPARQEHAGPAQAPGLAGSLLASSPRQMAQRRAIRAAFGAAAQLPPARTAAVNPPVQRVIIRGEGKGEYLDDASEVEYAFITQSSNGKALLFANRGALGAVRKAILKQSVLHVDESSDRSVFDALETWYNAKKDDPDPTVAAALSAVSFVLVEEDKETPGTYTDFGTILLDKLKAVLGGATNAWGRLTFKKPGFGERAPVAKGEVTMNTDTAIDKDKIGTGLGVEKEELDSGRFSGVKFTGVDNAAYGTAATTAGTKAIAIPGQQGQYFYVSTATREARTTSATEGNYVLNKRKFEKLSDIPTDDGDINGSYAALVTSDRAVQDWATVSNVGMRAGTQDQAMGGWNALGMAAYASRALSRNDLKLDQDYEWLHIRGVQNGGRNLVANLGTGTWIANSAMIPYENQIRTWADKKPGTIEARYEATASPANSPVLDKITIKIAASANHEIGPIARSDPLTVEFNAQSGLLHDTFTNKIKMKAYGQSAQDLSYRQGVIAARAGNPELNGPHQQGHRDYLAGVATAGTGAGAPATQGGAEGHADYLAGVAAAQAGLGTATAGEAQGLAHYNAGVAAARAGAGAGTGGNATGHADYLQGIAIAAGFGPLPGIHGQALGYGDWNQGYAQATAGNAFVPVHLGQQQGYQAGQRHVAKQSKVRKSPDDRDRDEHGGPRLKEEVN